MRRSRREQSARYHERDARAEGAFRRVRTANVAFQYHLLKVLWPELEVNWTYFASGQRGGLNQVFLTPGLVIGRFKLAEGFAFTWGVGYQFVVSPEYRPNPLTPAYNHAWLLTTRFNF